MLDLHYHLLPGIDDGAPDLDTSLAMARMSVADGVTVVACTPHIYPGLYENTRDGIVQAIAALRLRLQDAGLPLRLVEGADVHLVPGLLDGIRGGTVPTLAGSRYLLLEPSHHVAPPRFEQSVFELMAEGLVPVITHPERLSWVEHDYEVFLRLSRRGAWMQITAGALTGRFGRRPRYWAERFIGEGHCMILATDAHDPRRRPPLLAEAREAAARLVGATEATHMVLTRPQGIVDDVAPEALPLAMFQQPGFEPRPMENDGMLAKLLRPFTR
ncbi:tyrosine-protein phosphatase [Pseudoxanthomonas koreensis]|uniref:tyrosine-protein phosphatase n=1 Tax=Pseudoxanthomonas koreensis TaxID=266061 RepID=UPI0035A652FF